MNLLQETMHILAEHGKKTNDVVWCGAKNFGYCTFDEFTKMANVEYDCGFGCQEIADDLLVVGDSWWLERHEYDGSEW